MFCLAFAGCGLRSQIGKGKTNSFYRSCEIHQISSGTAVVQIQPVITLCHKSNVINVQSGDRFIGIIN